MVQLCFCQCCSRAAVVGLIVRGGVCWRLKLTLFAAGCCLLLIVLEKFEEPTQTQRQDDSNDTMATDPDVHYTPCGSHDFVWVRRVALGGVWGGSDG